MHKKIKFLKNELLNMIKLTQFIKKFNGSFGPPYSLNIASNHTQSKEWTENAG